MYVSCISYTYLVKQYVLNIVLNIFPFKILQKAKSFKDFIKFIKHMKSVVDDDELRVRITMKWMSQHSHKIPPLGQSNKTEFAGYAQVHLFYKFCG